MSSHPANSLDPKLDLSFERIVAVPKEFIWRGWTEPELLKQWFCPLPWKTVECEIDLRPGGIFRTVMQSPAGQQFPGTGCYLEVIENEKLVWTSGLTPGFRPAAPVASSENQPQFLFTAIITLSAHKDGTKYSATVLHADEIGCQQHAAMGFHEGWGKALDQLVALAAKQ